jgi:hypothetical protein
MLAIAMERIRASIDAYVAAWNEHDAAERARHIAAACSDDLRIVVGGETILGRDALDAAIADFHRRRPGDRGRLSSAVEVQADAFRFCAVVEGSTVAPPIELMDAGECDADGRIRLILTFVGAAPAPRDDASRLDSAFDAYVAAWNERDVAERVRVIAASCSDDLRIVTAGKPIVGHDGLAAAIADFRRRHPDARVRTTSAFESHGSAFRVSGLVDGLTAAPPAAATDVGECAPDGRIRLLLTFPSLAPARLASDE